jgi:hypothetical protein
VGRLTAALVAAVAAAALVGCGGEEDLAATGPGAAQVDLLSNLYDGRYGRAWADLHPAHQRIAPRPRFVRCAQAVAPTGDLEAIEVLDVFDDDAEIPAIPDAESRAVRLRVTSFEGETDTFVNHSVRVDDRWRWVLNGKSVAAYRQNRCPR